MGITISIPAPNEDESIPSVPPSHSIDCEKDDEDLPTYSSLPSSPDLQELKAADDEAEVESKSSKQRRALESYDLEAQQEHHRHSFWFKATQHGETYIKSFLRGIRLRHAFFIVPYVVAVTIVHLVMCYLPQAK